MEGRGLPSLPIKKDLNGLSLNGARNLPKLELYNFIENYEKCLTFELIQSLKLLNVA